MRGHRALRACSAARPPDVTSVLRACSAARRLREARVWADHQFCGQPHDAGTAAASASAHSLRLTTPASVGRRPSTLCRASCKRAQACLLSPGRALSAASVAARRKRKQSASGQRHLRAFPLAPAVHLLTAEATGASGEAGAQCGEAAVPTQLALCSTPAGAAEHLRSVRRAVMHGRKQTA